MSAAAVSAIADSCVRSRNRLAGIARGAIHRPRRRGLGDEGHRRADIHEQLQHDDVHRVERGGQPKRQWHGDDHDQRDLRAQVEGDRAPQLGGQPATALDRADDRRVRVIDEHQVGRLAGEIGSARAHGDPDVRRGEGRRVVDAVAGDGDRLAPILEDSDQAKLVLGRRPRDDGLAAQPRGELVVVKGVERRAAVQNLGSADPGLARGRGDRLGMVAADDDRPYAGVGELGHGIADTGAQRIAEGGQPDELELGLGVGGVAGGAGDTPVGDRDDPQPVVREPRDAREHRNPLRLGHRARVEDGLRRSLHGHPRAARVAPHRALAPAHRIERVAGETLARREAHRRPRPARDRPGPARPRPRGRRPPQRARVRGRRRCVRSEGGSRSACRSCRRAARSSRRRPRRHAAAAAGRRAAPCADRRARRAPSRGSAAPRGSWRTRASARRAASRARVGPEGRRQAAPARTPLTATISAARASSAIAR